ncbi:MAG: hypothetical protein D6814_11225 [Calditrichaeota bacterium]|nr:MAG: hypothetical protein D6814_11225 [Calditrichota bacterium]
MKKLIQLSSLLALTLAMLSIGCGKNNPAAPEPTVEPTPTFSISSKPVILNDGNAGIQFFAQPDMDVILVRVEIKDPLGNSFTFNAGSATVVKGEVMALQDTNLAYFRVSGKWTFKFVGNKATGSKASFDVTATLNVSA